MIISCWSAYAFISQPSKASEIINVIKNMYASQKSFVVDVIELSKILVKESSENQFNENNNIVKTELLTESEDKSQLDESTIAEDNADNPLGIVIEPSLPEVNENLLPKITEQSLEDKGNDSFMDEMGMDMNS